MSTIDEALKAFDTAVAEVRVRNFLLVDRLRGALARALEERHLKALDDPRLQEMFSSTISGALALGAADELPPPAGHWLESWWQRGRELALRQGDAVELSSRERSHG